MRVRPQTSGHLLAGQKRPNTTAMSSHKLGLCSVYARTINGNRMSYHGHAHHALYRLKISSKPKALLSDRSGRAATLLSCPVLSCPVLSCPVLSCPVLSCPVLSCPVLSCPVLSCPVLSCPVLSCPVLSCPVHANHACMHPAGSFIRRERAESQRYYEYPRCLLILCTSVLSRFLLYPGPTVLYQDVGGSLPSRNPTVPSS